jgi:hypothetical protein
MAKFVKMASLLILVCFIVAATLMVNAKADVVFGVSQGNVFEYNMIGHWSASESIPVSLLELNQTKTVTITVTKVADSVISTKILTDYKNGTQTTADGSCNIATGECKGLPFVGANLAKNDLVNPSASEAWYINDTSTRTYQNSTRDTNHLRIEDSGTEDPYGVVNSTYDYYFDKTTGVLVAYTTELTYGDVTAVTESSLLASNVWQVGADQIQNQPTPTVTPIDSSPSSPTILYIAAAIVAVVIAVAVVALVLKRR